MAWLRAVYFLDQNRGWVAGSNGTLLETGDGGDTWRKVPFVTRDALIDVYFSSEQVGWLLAQRDVLKLKSNERGSYLLNTNDGGVTWRRLFLNTSDVNTRFVRLLFTDPQNGWVFGETGVLFATNDGGAHWMPQRSVTRHLLLNGAFANDGHAFIVGAGATIMQSNDRGATWQLSGLRNVANARFNGVTAVGSFAWAVGSAGDIFATSDGGRAWSRQHSNVEADLFDVKFIDARQGWAVGAQGALLHTTDGGIHWFTEPTPNAHALQRLFIIDRNHAWAVGFGGMILRLGDASAPSLR
jgi:photosystem II stability/assembly factor-like uncharacterized protein